MEVKGLMGYENWILLSNELSDKALMEQIRKVENECLEKALIWSLRANRSFNMLVDEVKIFDNVKKALRFADKIADVVCVSEANMDTLEKEKTYIISNGVINKPSSSYDNVNKDIELSLTQWRILKVIRKTTPVII